MAAQDVFSQGPSASNRREAKSDDHVDRITKDPTFMKKDIDEFKTNWIDGKLGVHVSKIDTLRARLNTTKPAIAMAAHNPLAAKLAAEAGFGAVWVSGFELSASYAVPDASILPMSIILEVTRAMGEVQDLPVIVDLDTGFGNAVNVAYAIPRFAAAGAAAVVIEDKTFPKDSSLRSGGHHALVSIAEFQGKIAAAKAASSVLVIARTEALIADLGENEALRRGAAYAEAGADAVLIHSKQKTPDEILSFCRAWPGRVPLVLVPTSYPQLSFAEVAALDKIGLIICGNHAIRAAVASMRRTFSRILKDGGIAGVEQEIAPVSDIFALQGDASMRALERAYLS
jgi:phosphonopyruvate hydrolase